MATKELIFDMDGTIADLYGIDGWLEMLRAENVTPYAIARPLYDMDSLSFLLNIFKDIGYKIIVVSWGPKGATKEYGEKVRETKVEWLKRNGFPYDIAYIVKYGTPKQNFISANVSILIDDNEDVRKSFLNGAGQGERQVIDATKNIIEALANLLAEL